MPTPSMPDNLRASGCRSCEAGGNQAPAGPSVPPVANRGGVTQFEGLDAASEVWRGVDFLRATMPRDLAESIIANPPMPILDAGPGTGKAEGFRTSHVYQVLGGTLYRRQDPVMPSKRWGLNYESWEAAGGGGEHLADLLGPHATELRVTRLDLAIDVTCSYDLAPRAVFSEFADLDQGKAPGGGHVGFDGRGHPTRLTANISGHGAPRSLRMYRKDIQAPMLYGCLDEAVMRVELELSKPNAHPMYLAYVRDEPSSWAAFGRHVYEMTNRELVPIGDLPPVETATNVEVFQTLLEMCEQYGHYMAMAHDVGLDLVELAAIRDARKPANRMAKLRKERRRMAFGLLVDALGVDGVQAKMAEILERRNRVAIATS